MPLLLQVLRDRPGRLVGAVPRLLRQHRLAEEPLVQLALDDLLADVLGLRRAPLRSSRGSRARRRRAPAAPRRARRTSAARTSGAARGCAPPPGRRPSSARSRRPCSPASARSTRSPRRPTPPCASCRRPGCSRRAAPRARRARPRATAASPPSNDGRAAPSPRTRGSRRCSRRARSRSRSRAIAPTLSRTITPTLPSLVARSARFAADAMPFSRRSLTASSKSPFGLLERALALHHPGARRVAELLHHRRGDVGHALASSSASSSARPARRGCRLGRCLGSPERPRLPARLGSAARPLPRRLPAAAAACRCASRRAHLGRRHLLLAGLDPVGDRLDRRARTSGSRRRCPG